MEDKKWKKKALALSLVTTMVIASPLTMTGCFLDDKYDKQEKDDNTTYHGGGSTPFIYMGSGVTSSSNSGDSEPKFSSSSWKSWTAPSTGDSYSGVHMSGFSG